MQNFDLEYVKKNFGFKTSDNVFKFVTQGSFNGQPVYARYMQNYIWCIVEYIFA